MSNFKTRKAELEAGAVPLFEPKMVTKGAELCLETLKTSKSILQEVMGDNFEAKDVIALYPHLIRAEVEVTAVTVTAQKISSSNKADIFLDELSRRTKDNN